MAILKSDKTGFKTKSIARDKGHFIIIKGTIQQEDITITNLYEPNNRAIPILGIKTIKGYKLYT